MRTFIVEVLRDRRVDTCIVLATDEKGARRLAAFNGGTNSVPVRRVATVNEVEKRLGVIFSKKTPYSESHHKQPAQH
jgi:hypothetical protein